MGEGEERGGEGRRREGGDVQSIVFLGSEDGVVGLEVVLGEPSLVDGRRDIQKRISQGKDNVLDLFSGHFWLCKRGGARHPALPAAQGDAVAAAGGREGWGDDGGGLRQAVSRCMVDAGMNAWMQRGCLCLLRCLVRALGIGLDGRWSVAHRWGVHANKFTPFPHPSIESATFVVHCHVATVLYPSRFIVIKPQESIKNTRWGVGGLTLGFAPPVYGFGITRPWTVWGFIPVPSDPPRVVILSSAGTIVERKEPWRRTFR